MTTQNALPSSNANAAGFPPAPSETLQKANELRDARVAQSVRFALVFEDVALGVMVFVREVEGGRIHMRGYSGKRGKPDFYFSFKDAGAAMKHRDGWYAGIVSAAQTKAARKAEKAAALAVPQTALAVGDVLVSSWGYEQTNYDYYQVIRLVGARSVEIRKIASLSEETGFMQGDCVPSKNNFTGPAMVKRVDERGTVKVHTWGVYATKHQSQIIGGVEVFKPNRFTAYA